MKTRFSTVDLLSVISEIKSNHIGLRVNNVYDVDNRTYLIKLTGTEGAKAMILIESGNRIHSTEYDWPKNPTPSGFTMKLRKHLRNRRLESVRMLGMDRIVDFCFGSGEAAYHVFAEIYDRGNIVLTDHELTIMNLLRARTDESQDVRFAVRERYPVEAAQQRPPTPSRDALKDIFVKAKPTDVLKRVLNPHLVYGPAVIEHALLVAGLNPNSKVSGNFDVDENLEKLEAALTEAENILNLALSQEMQGVIVQKKEKRPSTELEGSESNEDFLLTYDEFQPYLFQQFRNNEKVQVLDFSSFSQAVDEFFSKIESQKIDTKALQQEKSALKKLENVKADHAKRLQVLRQTQEGDRDKGDLIELNVDLVEMALSAVRSLIANQVDWEAIRRLVGEAAAAGDPVAARIKGLKLETNSFVLLLHNPYDGDFNPKTASRVEIDVELSAHANSRRYFDHRRQASEKEGKTVDSSAKALKNAEKKTKQVLREVQTAVAINKHRHTHWFEKFLWFISSENFIVIAGRDAQQNELLVKKYFRPGDVYVHADLHGAATVIVRNHPGYSSTAGSDEPPIPPKTLSEAGTMAVCHSQAWDAKIVTSAWWVHHHQVTKTAPTGEYLSTGSFMIRGKKNYLPPCYLIMGFGFMFRLDEDSLQNHEGERRVKGVGEDEREDVDEDEMADEEEEVEEADVKLKEVDGKEESELSLIEKDEIKKNPSMEKKTTKEEVNQTENNGAKRDEDCLPDFSSPLSDVKGDSSSSPRAPAKAQAENIKAEEEDEGERAFPDTEIRIQVDSSNRVKKLKAFKGLGSLTNNAESPDSQKRVAFEDDYVVEKPDGTKIVTLGENVAPLVLGPRHTKDGAQGGAKPKLSAKQRRDLKKQKKQNGFDNNEEEEEGEEGINGNGLSEKLAKLNAEQDEEGDNDDGETEGGDADSQDGDPIKEPQQPLKRGKRNKMKKMKEKYRDQDDEDKERAIALLQAGGGEEEKKLKGKKAKEIRKKEKDSKLASREQRRKDQRERFTNREPTKIGDSQVVGATVAAGREVAKEKSPAEAWTDKTAETDKPEMDSDSEDEAAAVGTSASAEASNEDLALINALTGAPLEEDTLLYVVPVCGPYAIMNNYKFKVKLTPGTNKKGKAAKTALNLFLHDRSTNLLEKDLMKAVKDVDLSRNIPGKVKLSAPHLHAAKAAGKSAAKDKKKNINS